MPRYLVSKYTQFNKLNNHDIQDELKLKGCRSDKKLDVNLKYGVSYDLNISS